MRLHPHTVTVTEISPGQTHLDGRTDGRTRCVFISPAPAREAGDNKKWHKLCICLNIWTGNLHEVVRRVLLFLQIFSVKNFQNKFFVRNMDMRCIRNLSRNFDTIIRIVKVAQYDF